MSGRSQLIKLVSISTINIFFFTDLFILFFDWSQLLFIVEILFVFSFQTPRMKFSAQIWAFIVYAWEIQLLVNWIAIWAPCVLVHELLLLVLRQEVPLVVVPSLIEVVLREQLSSSISISSWIGSLSNIIYLLWPLCGKYLPMFLSICLELFLRFWMLSKIGCFFRSPISSFSSSTSSMGSLTLLW